MAKDKSKKNDSDKAEKKAKKGGDPFAKPSEAPSTSDAWRFEHADNLGKLFLITPYKEEEKEDKFKPGSTKSVIIADVVEINEKKPAESELHTNVWINGGWTKGSLRGFIGEQKVLARLGQGPLDRGNKPWTLEDATEDDKAPALSYLESVDPFKQ